MIRRIHCVETVVALTAGFYAVVLALQLMKNGGDVSAFSAGTDGAFFHQIALLPFDVDWIRAHTDVGPYRHQRILYPLIAFALSLGKAEWVPVALIAINFGWLLLVAGFAASLCRRQGVTPLAGLFVSRETFATLRSSDLCHA